MTEQDDSGPNGGSGRSWTDLLGSDFPTRLVAGLVLGVVAAVVTVAGVAPFAVLVVLVALIVSWEWGRLVHGPDAGPVVGVQMVAVAAAGVLAALGLALYGTVYLIPLYLAQVQGYSPFQIGLTLMWVGIPQLMILPFVPKLMKLVDPRIVAAIGLALFGGSCVIDGFLSPDFAIQK